MVTNYQDTDLELRIDKLKTLVQNWAISRDLWDDCGFKSWAEHFDDEPPEHPYVLVMWHDGQLAQEMSGYTEVYDELNELIEKTDFAIEVYDHDTTCFRVKDESLENAYRDYYEWEWILDLIKPDYDSLYSEIYEHFQQKPDDVYRLEPRQFELFLDAIFRNNGYRTELGSGQGDGGVDLRLYSNDVVGEAVTLVQAKRYAKSRPIRLEAVQSLSATVEDERANRGLFVTTSRFLPSAQKFAARQNRKLALATTKDIQQWSDYASKRILRDKSLLISPTTVQTLLEGKNTTGLEGKIFCARTGYTIYDNEFALLLKESKGAALLMKLPDKVVSGNIQRGTHIPELNISALSFLNGKNVFRAKKNINERGQLYLWGDLHLYTLWDGTPQEFDRMD